MKTPNGADILKTLLDLYAKQEGVKISYKILNRSENESDHTEGI